MLEHRENTEVKRQVRGYRMPLARTLCNRWVDVVRLALPTTPTNCDVCKRREAEMEA